MDAEYVMTTTYRKHRYSWKIYVFKYNYIEIRFFLISLVHIHEY